MFGGDGRQVRIPEDRDFTLIEVRVIQKISEEICRCYADSWQSVHPIQVQAVSKETNIQFVNIAQPSDPVAVVTATVTIDSSRSTLAICLPYATLDPIKDMLKGSYVGTNLDPEDVAAGGSARPCSAFRLRCAAARLGDHHLARPDAVSTGGYPSTQ